VLALEIAEELEAALEEVCGDRAEFEALTLWRRNGEREHGKCSRSKTSRSLSPSMK